MELDVTKAWSEFGFIVTGWLLLVPACIWGARKGLSIIERQTQVLMQNTVALEAAAKAEGEMAVAMGKTADAVEKLADRVDRNTMAIAAHGGAADRLMLAGQ